MSASDPELLQRFVTEASETAFGELVQRHAGLVYSVAARFPRLEPSEVEDVAQRVFVLLARKAAGLTSHPSLTAWLFTTTRQIAFRHQRSETRRIIREQKTHEMSQDNTPDGPPVDWTSLRPVIDEALGELDECDQKAVLWRYFEKQGYALIGSRLGLSEEAARKRVTRALHALHSGLSKRGVTSTAAAVGLALEVNAVMASPEGLPGRILSSMAASGAFLGSGGMLKIGVARWSRAATRVRLEVAAIGILATGWVAYRVAHFPQSRDGARVSPETQAGLGSSDSEGALARLRSSTAARALEEAADLEDALRRLREVLRFGDGGTLLTAAINLFGERVPEAVPVLLEGLASDQPDAATASISGLKLVLTRLSAGGRESERAPILNQIRPLLGAVLADVHRPASQQSRALETLSPPRLTPSISEDPESLLWVEKVLHETSSRQIGLRFEIIDRLVMPSVYGPEGERVIRGLLPMLSSNDPADRILAAYAYALAPVEKPSAVTSVLVAAVRGPFRYRAIAVGALGELGTNAVEAVPALLELAGTEGNTSGALMAACRIQPELRRTHPEIHLAILHQEVELELQSEATLGRSFREWVLGLGSRAVSGWNGSTKAQLMLCFVNLPRNQAIGRKARIIEALEREAGSGTAEERRILQSALYDVRTLPVPEVHDITRVDLMSLTLSAHGMLRVQRSFNRKALGEALNLFEAENLPPGSFPPLAEPETLTRLIRLLDAADPTFSVAWRHQVLKEFPGMILLMQK